MIDAKSDLSPPLNLSLVLASSLLSLLILMALIGPYLSGFTYDAALLEQVNQAPSAQHWFGTDDLGRDLFTRVCYGLRISLAIGIAAACLDFCIGFLFGGLAGLLGGWIDEILMRAADVIYCIPSLLITILMIMVLGSGFTSMVMALGMTGWIPLSRLIRAQILQIKQQDYFLGGIVIGANRQRLLTHYIFPNVQNTILVSLMLSIPSAIFSEAFLSFLGLGVQAPMASLGAMSYEALNAYEFYPWRLFFPGVSITLIVLGFHLMGEGLKNDG